jgi:hypothetical protein
MLMVCYLLLLSLFPPYYLKKNLLDVKWTWNFSLESHLEASIIAAVKHVAPYIYREEKRLNWIQHADCLVVFPIRRGSASSCHLRTACNFEIHNADCLSAKYWQQCTKVWDFVSWMFCRLVSFCLNYTRRNEWWSVQVVINNTGQSLLLHNL